MKKLIFVSISFILFSCGENKPAISRSDDGDSTGSASITKADSNRFFIDTTANKIKHEAFKDDIQNPPVSIVQFIPGGYTALDTATGDLNLDQFPDMILVLKKNGEDSTSDVIEHPEKRPLLILTGQADGSYKLAARSDNAVYCIDCGGMMGDPFMGVVIKNGFFSVEHYGGSAWRWTRTVTFKYSPGDQSWFLHKDGGESFHAADQENTTTKHLKTVKDFGKMAFEDFDIYKE